MRQRSERASTGAGRRSSSDRSRRKSITVDLESVSTPYEALLCVLPETPFVANAQGRLSLIRPPDSRQDIPPFVMIDGSYIRDTSLPGPAKLAFMKAVQRALTEHAPVVIQLNLKNHAKDWYVEISLARFSTSEVMGIVRTVHTSTPEPGHPDEAERRVFRHQISQELASAVIPIVTRMKDRARPSQRREAQFLEAQLFAILATDLDPFWERYSALTPREMELCVLLKGGLSSKQISQQLEVSLATVHKHREQIRRKLGFQHKRINLSSYLKLHALPVRT
jgi:DNA-binding CsgD family transcriptional regulator